MTISNDSPLYPFVQYEEQLKQTISDHEATIELLNARTDDLKRLIDSDTKTIGDLNAQVEYLTSKIPQAWQITAKTVTDTAKAFMSLNIPYLYDHEGREGMDCSGFTLMCFKNAGITLPRNSKNQSTNGSPVTSAVIREGDLIFFDTNKDGIVNHVGIYIGNNQMIHTNNPTLNIHIQDLTGVWALTSGTYFVNIQRYIM